MFLAPQLLGPVGLQVDTIDFYGVNNASGNSNPGSIMAIDIQQQSATKVTSGGLLSVLSNLQVPSNSISGEGNGNPQMTLMGVFAILLGNQKGEAVGVSVGEIGHYRLTGHVMALTTNDGAAGDALKGYAVFPLSGSKQLHCNGDTPDTVFAKCLGWLDEASLAADSATARQVTFNGLGIGTVFTVDAG